MSTRCEDIRLRFHALTLSEAVPLYAPLLLRIFKCPIGTSQRFAASPLGYHWSFTISLLHQHLFHQTPLKISILIDCNNSRQIIFLCCRIAVSCLIRNQNLTLHSLTLSLSSNYPFSFWQYRTILAQTKLWTHRGDGKARWGR